MPPGSGRGLPRRPPRAARAPLQAVACMPSSRYRPGRWSRSKVDGSAVAGLPEAIRDSAFQIAADGFLAGLIREEYDGVVMLVNHSCEPNVGMGGNVLLVAMRTIAAGEGLTIDYALFLGDPGFAMDCRCGTAACRGVVLGTDWMCTDVRERYRGWFSWWLQQKITQPGTTRAGSR